MSVQSVDRPFPTLAIRVRSIAFVTALWTSYAVVLLAALPLLLLPGDRVLRAMIKAWGGYVRVILRLLAGIDVRYQGVEHVPEQGPCIIASKHQSWCDGMLMVAKLERLSAVAMQELQHYPLVGPVMKKLGFVLVDTCGGENARQTLATGGAAAVSRNLRVLIYPEGELMSVGARGRYRTGIWHLYSALNIPVVPVATSIGLRWPRRAMLKTPGPATVAFLEPIAPGLERAEFMALLEERIEAETAALCAADAAHGIVNPR
ncbi:lysophospholipid acyltransferase family protein [Zavarzinia sp. CC-PAN008]|uniref:lysophospholipid acyltransferase family protein n=1 Tax=Zavarzinia sp. CC-PAN008 TaxID=3243332 RepID=UPI003F746316